MRDIDNIRRSKGALENHIIDEFVAGRITRREFIRRGSIVGISLPFMSLIAAGYDGASAQEQGEPQATPKPGGTLVVATPAPNEAIDPVVSGSKAFELIASQVGDFLMWSNEELQLEPRLAQSWKPNTDGSVWTFQLREGVTFHDGAPMTARDVAATFQRLADPQTKSNALSVFKGTLTPNGVRAVGDFTIEFHLEAANGNFPYLLSSDNYNAIIQPEKRPDNWEQTFIGTGAWKLNSYDPSTGLIVNKNTSYWDRTRIPLADSQEVRFFGDVQSALIAIRAGDAHVGVDLDIRGSVALAEDPNIRLIELKSAQHAVINMRTDQEPFNDKRVRQAVALLLNRDEIIAGLIKGKGDVGNDTPFAPVYPSTPKDAVQQRKQDIEQAKALLADAGKGDGFSVPLYAPNAEEVPDLAILLQDAAKAAGINFTPQVVEESLFYDKYWLDAQASIAKFSHRGVPNVFLTATLTSGGSWNATHFANERYDRLTRDYVAEVDLQSQRRIAGEMQQVLLDETPVVIPYFTRSVSVARKELVGRVRPTATKQLDVTQAGFNR